VPVMVIEYDAAFLGCNHALRVPITRIEECPDRKQDRDRLRHQISNSEVHTLDAAPLSQDLDLLFIKQINNIPAWGRLNLGPPGATTADCDQSGASKNDTEPFHGVILH
jgi:hypothetical protein